jgi:hypothetical protein
VAAGTFSTAGGVAANHIALRAGCPALVALSGGGCVGTAGPNVLTASTAPWIGTTFRATAAGMTGNALAVALFGLTANSTPLSLLLPQGVFGCSLHVSTESAQLLLPIAGNADTQLVIPNSSSFVGVTLHHQVIAAELGGLGNITAVTSTNALTLTVGVL